MTGVIESYRLTRYQIPRLRVVGDSQIRSDRQFLVTVELLSSSGLTGLGFQNAHNSLATLAQLKALFESEAASLIGENPFGLLNRQTRPRGGNIKTGFFSLAINQALWDLQAKELDLPLYRLLGGTSNRVKAYASGLDYHLSNDEFCQFFTMAREQGFTSFKIKVGHPDLNRDLNRLKLVREIIGAEAELMVDANEAWSPKEAVRRAWAYHEAGFNIFWIEDPCLRDDFAGLARVVEQVPFAHINSGEYLDLHGKRQLLEHRAVDILNLHGHISQSLQAAALAADYGIPITFGNTPLEIGVHLAAALPEVIGMEYAFHETYRIVDEPVHFEAGYACAPERPGHGMVLSEAARKEFARPE